MVTVKWNTYQLNKGVAMSSINRLAYFNSVVETGSIFDVQPSSISRQLAVLEKELGVRLLNKTTRNTSLTEAGTNITNTLSELCQSLITPKEPLMTYK